MPCLQRVRTVKYLRTWVRDGPWQALRYRNFRLLWWGQLVSVTGSQMRVVALGWQVYLISHDPLQLGILGLSQALALMVFSLVAGVASDAMERRTLLIIAEATMACGSTLLALATILQFVSLPLIYVVAFGMAAVSAFDYSARPALIPSLVPAAELPTALSLNALLFNLASIVGPVVGGLAIAGLGVGGAYTADALSFMAVVASLVAMNSIATPVSQRPRADLRAWREGFTYLRTRPVLLGLMALDFCATFFGSPQALLPIYARDILRVGPQGLGAVSSATAVGAVCGVLFTGQLRRIQRQGLGVLLGVAAWGVCIVLFGLTNGPLWPSAPWRHVAVQGPFWLALLLLAGAGASDLVSSVLRNTILQLSTPDAMRGRVSATNAIFVIGGPALGEFESGVVASWLTPQLSVLTGGAACLLATAAIGILAPDVRHYRAGSLSHAESAATATGDRSHSATQD